MCRVCTLLRGHTTDLLAVVAERRSKLADEVVVCDALAHVLLVGEQRRVGEKGGGFQLVFAERVLLELLL